MAKIIHVITRMIRGGADENTLLSCNAQAQKGHDVVLIYGDEVDEGILSLLDGRVKRYQVKTLIRKIDLVRDFKSLISLIRFLCEERPDIVHTHTSKAGILGRTAAFFGGGKVVHGVHILPFLNVKWSERSLYLFLESLLAPFTHAYINVSDGMMKEGLRYRVGAARKHHVVPSGMDVAKFREAASIDDDEALRTLGASLAGRKVICMVAALEPRKRIFEFLDVLAEVRRANPEVCLLVLGEGHDRSRLQRRIDALGLNGSAFLVGFRADVERWIARADVCVLASEREGLPRAIIQYVLGGRPVVSTDLPGVDAVVADGDSGYLVPVANVSAMIPPLVTLLSDDDLRAGFARRAGMRDLSRWSSANMASELETIYSGLLKSSIA